MKRLNEIRKNLVLSGLSLLFFLIAWAISIDDYIIIIHPVLGILGIGISVCFFFMYIFAYKKEEERKPTGDPILNKLAKDLETRIEKKNNLTDREKLYVGNEVRKFLMTVHDLYLKSLK